MGMARPAGSQPYPEAPSIGPSGIDLEGNLTGKPMSEKEITLIIQAFVDAAIQAKQLGFDGIEIQGAHGYLVDQFFWDKTNTRTDRYGGDLIKRSQFATELIQAIRTAVGPDCHSFIAMENERLLRQTVRYTGKAGAVSTCVGTGRRRYISLLDTSVLGAGI